VSEFIKGLIGVVAKRSEGEKVEKFTMTIFLLCHKQVMA